MNIAIPPMPPRIARLPRDRRGYPIPWNVLKGVDDFPIFTVNDSERHLHALRAELCPICGERLGRWRWFVGGIRSAFDPHGAYFDLPGHHECEAFALQVCPYLALPQYLGRIDVADPTKLPKDSLTLIDPTMIPERPAVFVSVASDKLEILDVQPGAVLIAPGRPYLGHEYWRHGQRSRSAPVTP
jgi:hypothetical protein